MREQGIAQQPMGAPQVPNYTPRVGIPIYANPGIERAQPVLGNQPPLPGAAVVRYVQPKDMGLEGALVLISYYGGESSEDPTNYVSSLQGTYEASTVVPKGQYNLDLNTLWFVANGGTRPGGQPGPRPYRPRPPTSAAPPGPCFNCGGDHWVRDCPHPRKERPTTPTLPPPAPSLPPLTRFCLDCGIKHFVQDCPKNPDNKGKATVGINLIEILPSTSSPSSSESDVVVPLKAITRAQARAKDESKREDEAEPTPSESRKKSKESWKARRAKRAASRKTQNEKTKEETAKNVENDDNKMGAKESNKPKEKESKRKKSNQRDRS